MALARLAALDRRLPFGTATLVAATVAGVLLSGTAAVVLDSPVPSVVAEGATPPPGTSPSARPSPSASATPEKPDEPIDYLVDVATVMPGYRRMSDGVAGAGPMDLEDAAVIEAGGDKPTESDREALRKLGFVRGHSRAWTNGQNHVIVIVYEWKKAEGPLTFVKGVTEVTTENGSGWRPPIDRAQGICSTDEDSTDDSILAAVGKHSFLVIVSRDGGCRRHELVVQVTDAITKHAKRLGA